MLAIAITTKIAATTPTFALQVGSCDDCNTNNVMNCQVWLVMVVATPKLADIELLMGQQLCKRVCVCVYLPTFISCCCYFHMQVACFANANLCERVRVYVCFHLHVRVLVCLDDKVVLLAAFAAFSWFQQQICCFCLLAYLFIALLMFFLLYSWFLLYKCLCMCICMYLEFLNISLLELFS